MDCPPQAILGPPPLPTLQVPPPAAPATVGGPAAPPLTVDSPNGEPSFLAGPVLPAIQTGLNGPRGPMGPPGPGGGGSDALVFDLTNVSSQTFAHTFAYPPMVHTADPALGLIGVEYPDSTHIHISFPSPFTGKVVLQ